jgi:hypothetical protein
MRILAIAFALAGAVCWLWPGAVVGFLFPGMSVSAHEGATSSRSPARREIELHLTIMLSRVQGIEIGNAVHAEHHRLAIYDETPLPVLQGGLNDPWIALAPVVTALRDQAHAIVVALHSEAVTIVFDLMQPVWVVRTWFPVVGMQNSNVPGMGRK